MVSYVVAPYRNAANTFVSPSVTNLTFTNGVSNNEITFDNFRLKGYKIAKGTTGGEVEFVTNDCQVLRYFLSATNDVQLNHRPAIGGFFDLHFQNHRHNFTDKTNGMAESTMQNSNKINLTQEITDFKTLHEVNDDFYLYFFCPFMKPTSDSSNLKVNLNLNNNAVDESSVTIKTKDQLEDEMKQINSGKEVSSTPTPDTPPSLKEKFDAILAEIKQEGTGSNKTSTLTQSPDKYYSVIRRTLDLKVGKTDAPDVEKVLNKVSQ